MALAAAATLAAAPVLAQQVTIAPKLDAQAGLPNDYPTEARADYVFVCMATNGQTRDALRRCSCSIDVIASILPYEKYVDAETVLEMRQVQGERVGMMRTAAVANDFVRDLKRAQAEGDVRCF
jgi:hypothetical protein